MEEELETRGDEFRRLQEEHDRSLHEVSLRQQHGVEATQKQKVQQQHIKELEGELGTKTDLVSHS